MVPELTLIGAVLIRAVSDCLGASPTTRDEKRKSLNWVTTWEIGDRKEPFTFPWVCEQLELCPNEIRKTILSLQEQKSDYEFGGRNSADRIMNFLNLDHQEPTLTKSWRRYG